MSIRDILDQSTELAAQFRRGKHVSATQALPELLESVLACASVDLGATKALVMAMLQCQERRDWLGMADYLEHELPALLEQASIGVSCHGQ